MVVKWLLLLLYISAKYSQTKAVKTLTIYKETSKLK